MHRSGTSMVTRLLNIGGLDLGDPMMLLDPQGDNPLGFWENRDIMSLNDRILAIKGGSWMDPPLWQNGWDTAPNILPLMDEASAILDKGFRHRGVSRWGWKDPRTTLTLPFWKRLVSPMRLVLVVRNPLDVAQSLRARHGWVTKKGIDLWKNYMNTAFRNGNGVPMFVTFYEDYFHDPRAEIQRLLTFCGLGLGTDEAQFLDTIRRDQRHHTTDAQGVLASVDCTDEVKAMYFNARAMKENTHKQDRSFDAQHRL